MKVTKTKLDGVVIVEPRVFGDHRVFFMESWSKKKFEEADLVIGHAGAGTIMEVLQLGKPLIVVVNGDLMENHQTEVAREFYQRGLLQMSTLDTFLDVFKSAKIESKKITHNTDGIFKELDSHFNFYH